MVAKGLLRQGEDVLAVGLIEGDVQVEVRKGVYECLTRHLRVRALFEGHHEEVRRAAAEEVRVFKAAHKGFTAARKVHDDTADLESFGKPSLVRSCTAVASLHAKAVQERVGRQNLTALTERFISDSSVPLSLDELKPAKAAVRVKPLRVN